MAKRKTSESVKKMRLIILGLSVALIAAVVLATWFTLSRESENGSISWNPAATTEKSDKIAGEPDQTTTAANGSDTQLTTGADGLPYDKSGSDAYAEWNGKYNTAEVILKMNDSGKWLAYVRDEHVKDCTGVYVNEFGWWFVRNGEVDFQYNGIASNNVGKWYITDGQVNFDWSGAYTPPGSDHHYTVVEGSVVRESQG
ncbi:MAG: hypothetical protein IJ241_06700 [Clostridia bacterium]|nr:hypothetical protein [Clostridia bacterium]MBQ8925929.1 hypothetical protein [Clostridia bacterium]